MLIHPVQFDPMLIALVVIGVLTLFGRKKKEEKKDEAKPEQGSKAGSPAPLVPTSGSSGKKDEPVGISGEIEETPLTKLLQSLLQDVPLNQSSNREESSETSVTFRSTPDWVPPRLTPPSRPMVITPGDKGKKEAEPEKQPAAVELVMPPKPLEEVPREVVREKPSTPVPKAEEVEVKVKKPERELEEKVKGPEKELEKKGEKRREARSPKGFEHIFELTQGTLQAPGLVVVNGPLGSGKTTLCAGLADRYLKEGSPCLFVTYDQAPAKMREEMKTLRCDPSERESQFRFLLVDGFSTQSEAFSFEPYYVEQPFDLDKVQEALVRNSQIFFGEKIRIILDSMDGIIAKTPAKEFLKKFRELVSKMKESGITFVVTVDPTGLPKSVAELLEEMAECVIDLEKGEAGTNGRVLKTRKLNGAVSKAEPEMFEIDASKGLLFV